MSNLSSEVDPQLCAEFIDDSLEGLSQVSDMFVELEADPTNTETISAIFRVAHSIKGSAAYFELMRIKVLSHEMETLLDLAREGKMVPSGEIIDVLLASVDELVAMFKRARGGEPEVVDEAHFTEIVKKVTASAGGEEANQEALWKTLLEALRLSQSGESPSLEQLTGTTATALECASKLAAMSNAGCAAAKPPEVDRETWPEPVRALGDLVRSTEADGLDDAAAQQGSDILKQLKDIVVGPEAQAIVQAAVVEYATIHEAIGSDPILREILDKLLATLTETVAWEAPKTEVAAEVAKEAVGGQPPTPQETGKTSGKAKGSEPGPVKTMRVTEESIDAFLADVGELIVLGEMFNNLQSCIMDRTAATELRRVNEVFGKLTRDLQHGIMDVRKVPIGTLLKRAPRIVRDVAAASGKEIETHISGEKVAIDRSLIEVLEAPLVHIVRNAADHGIEKPEKREAVGKSRTGHVEISAVESEDHVVLTIRDDGNGLDYDALAAKAVSMGIIPAGRKPTDDEITDLLFSPGVSTAETVTDVSGRGVGMDVAKRNIESMKGRIEVTSTPGQGSVFTIRMPKSISTQILTGFTVVVGKERYILPIERVVRCYRLERGQITTIGGRGACMHHGDEVLCVYRLHSIWGHAEPLTAESCDGIVVIVEMKDCRAALHVDDVEGVKQVVLKEIECLGHNSNVFQGGAIMGDGAVATIVDIDRLVHVIRDVSLAEKNDVPPSLDAKRTPPTQEPCLA